VLVSEGARSSSRGDAELHEDVLDVAGDRVLADEQGCGDLPIALPCCHESQDFKLSIGQAVCRRDPRQQRLHPRVIGFRLELFERVASSLEFQRSCVLITLCPASQADENSHARDLVRRLKVEPKA
jgi:hypothetical protein